MCVPVAKSLRRSKPKSGGTRIVGGYINSIYDSEEPDQRLSLHSLAVLCLALLHVSCRSSKNVIIGGGQLQH